MKHISTTRLIYLPFQVGPSRMISMHRRPWPIVFLAVLQLLSPIGTVVFSAIANRIGIFDQLRIIWTHAPLMDRFAIFVMPIALAWLIYFTKKVGLFFIAATVIYTFTKNIIEWRSIGDLSSWAMLIFVNFCNFALIAYLLAPSVREIFLNPHVRWWEREPRYILNIEAAVFQGDHEQACYLQDISSQGASFQCLPGIIHRGDTVKLKFKYKKHEIAFMANIMYERTINGDSTQFGLRRIDENRHSGESMLMSNLIAELKKNKCPTTQMDADSKKSLISWAKRAARSPQAWFPEKIDRAKISKQQL
jgi:hypothetical protein